MRDLLDRYVRSLREQEQAPDAPEYRQDLGTFVDWLLVRHGFKVHLRTYHHEGPARRKSSGWRQWGRDILATKPDSDGAVRGYRFVLKQGNMDLAQWNEMERGSLPNDLLLAAGLHPEADKMHMPGQPIDRWSVIAVHNGDVITERIGPQRRSLMEHIKSRGIDIEWWDAQRLVELALEPPATPEGKSVVDRSDPSLLPPGARPFARLALDSLARNVDAGAAFDLGAVNHLVATLLPGHKRGRLRAVHFYTALTELSLFAGMVDVDCRTLPQLRGCTLPALDTFERILCRALHLGGIVERVTGRKHRKHVRNVVRLLLTHYVRVAARLVDHLLPVLSLDRGLAISSLSEQIDYPIRTLRLCGYIAAAGAAALDLSDDATAQRFAEVLRQIVEKNPGGALNPVLDDQIIEISLVWDLWRRTGMDDAVQDSARELLGRLLFRRDFGMPLPALWIDARVPPNARGLRTLVEAQYRRPTPGFEDGGSQILPLALYLGCRELPAEEAQRRWAAFAPRETGEQSEVRVIHPQSWLPPDDAAEHWYGNRLARCGTAHVFRTSLSFSDFVAEFERFNRPLPGKSRAMRWKLPSLDRIAWKVFRNPPPMALFVQPPEARPPSP